MNPPAHIRDERATTLVELLAVMMVIGILSAIGMPAFLGQESKGQDAKAKSAARVALTAAETYFTDSDTYDGMDPDALRKIEPSLDDAEGATLAVTVADGGKSFELSVVSDGGNVFSLERNQTAGDTSRTCVSAGNGGCPSDGKW